MLLVPLVVPQPTTQHQDDPYYTAYSLAVNHPTVLAALDDKAPETLAAREATTDLLSPFTMIRVEKADKGFGFRTEPFAVFFEAVLLPVLAAFDATADALAAVPEATEAQQAEIVFLRQYRTALAETEVAQLEPQWNLVDRKWMDCKGEIQVVHDIEDGYSDPLRAKQGPDFSIRFLDETYAGENATIKEIQSLICEYYAGRDSKLSKDGLTALSNTMAGIYYIPFKTGCSLVFSYSGQSIPNRLDVKKDKGVKIYFDAVETAARVEQVKLKVKEFFEDADALVLRKYEPDAVEQLVWHVAAHEVGHAIYGVSNMAAHVEKATTTMLEEPRAELTAMFTLRRLHETGRVTLPELEKYLVHFALDAIRYFSKYNSQPLQHGNFDVISDRLSRVFRLHAAAHTSHGACSPCSLSSSHADWCSQSAAAAVPRFVSSGRTSFSKPTPTMVSLRGQIRLRTQDPDLPRSIIRSPSCCLCPPSPPLGCPRCLLISCHRRAALLATAVYNKHGFITRSKGSGQLAIDPSATLAVLDEFSAKFEVVLDCCDADDAAAGKILDGMVIEMSKPTPFTQSVIDRCLA